MKEIADVHVIPGIEKIADLDFKDVTTRIHNIDERTDFQEQNLVTVQELLSLEVIHNECLALVRRLLNVFQCTPSNDIEPGQVRNQLRKTIAELSSHYAIASNPEKYIQKGKRLVRGEGSMLAEIREQLEQWESALNIDPSQVSPATRNARFNWKFWQWKW